MSIQAWGAIEPNIKDSYLYKYCSGVLDVTTAAELQLENTALPFTGVGACLQFLLRGTCAWYMCQVRNQMDMILFLVCTEYWKISIEVTVLYSEVT